MFSEKGVLKTFADFTGKYQCWSLFLVKSFSGKQIYQNKKRLQHRFFCEICEGFKNTYFEEHLRTTASKLLFREKPHWPNKKRFTDIANTFHKDRISRPKLFCKNVAFKKFTKFTIKQLCRSLALKIAARRRTINERLLHKHFPVSFAIFLRTPILKNLCEWLLTV